MPLYDILNEFQKGGSHMAAVVAVKQKKRKFCRRSNQEDRKGVKEYQVAEGDIEKGFEEKLTCSNGIIPVLDPSSDTEYELGKGEVGLGIHDEVEKMKMDIEHGDVIGIITMEDVMEELLQVPIPQILKTLNPISTNRENLLGESALLLIDASCNLKPYINERENSVAESVFLLADASCNLKPYINERKNSVAESVLVLSDASYPMSMKGKIQLQRVLCC